MAEQPGNAGLQPMAQRLEMVLERLKDRVDPIERAEVEDCIRALRKYEPRGLLDRPEAP